MNLESRRSESDKPLGGRYRIIKGLGSGGFGQTFLAVDLHLPDQPYCVLKQLNPQVKDEASFQLAKRLFDTEAKVLYRLGEHPQIPRLLAHFEEAQEFYLAQELIEGQTLSELLLPGQAWTESQVLSLLRDILETLAFVHQQNVIHRDLKPSNLIRRSRDQRIVLIDFGAVKQTNTRLINPDTPPTHTISIGTRGYMPSEQIAGQPRFSSDIYAVGMIGIQALTGSSPRHFSQDPDTGEILWHPDYPIHPKLQAILDRMICYDFRDRYTTALEALQALNQLPATLSESPQPETTDVDLTLLPTQPTSHPDGSPKAEPFSTVQSSQFATLPVIQPDTASFQRLNFPDTAFRKLSIWTQNRVMRVGAVAAIVGASLFWLQGTFRPRSQTPQATSQSIVQKLQPALNQSSVATLLAQADRFRTAKQYAEAIKVYDQTIAQNSKSAQAHWGKCYSLNQLQQYQQAMAACDRALAVNANDAQAIWSKGYALEHQQRYTDALKLYERAVQLKPDFAEAWSNRGSVLFQLNRTTEAVASFDRATALNPKLAEAWNNRGAALWKLRQFDEAVASIDQAIQIQPDYQDALSLRQQMRQRLGR